MRSTGVGSGSATHTRLSVTAPKTPLKSPLVQGGTLFSSNLAQHAA